MATAYIVAWAVAFVFFILCELATSIALVSIWFAVGALFAMFAAIFKLSFLMQLTIFVVSSVLMLILTRPIVKKLQKEIKPTNYELDIGKTATVTEDIDSSANKGRVNLNGTYWQAKALTGEKIDKGSLVTIVSVEGTTLVVKKNQ